MKALSYLFISMFYSIESMYSIYSIFWMFYGSLMFFDVLCHLVRILLGQASKSERPSCAINECRNMWDQASLVEVWVWITVESTEMSWHCSVVEAPLSNSLSCREVACTSGGCLPQSTVDIIWISARCTHLPPTVASFTAFDLRFTWATQSWSQQPASRASPPKICVKSVFQRSEP